MVIWSHKWHYVVWIPRPDEIRKVQSILTPPLNNWFTQVYISSWYIQCSRATTIAYCLLHKNCFSTSMSRRFIRLLTLRTLSLLSLEVNSSVFAFSFSRAFSALYIPVSSEDSDVHSCCIQNGWSRRCSSSSCFLFHESLALFFSNQPTVALNDPNVVEIDTVRPTFLLCSPGYSSLSVSFDVI